MLKHRKVISVPEELESLRKGIEESVPDQELVKSVAMESGVMDVPAMVS